MPAGDNGVSMGMECRWMNLKSDSHLLVFLVSLLLVPYSSSFPTFSFRSQEVLYGYDYGFALPEMLVVGSRSGITVLENARLPDFHHQTWSLVTIPLLLAASPQSMVTRRPR